MNFEDDDENVGSGDNVELEESSDDDNVGSGDEWS